MSTNDTNNVGSPATLGEHMNCYCIVKHALTAEEKLLAAKRLEEARLHGDQVGVLLSLAALATCPSMK